jgi:glycosidase
VILDGVYSHTGADSLYFDKQSRFGGKGAYCDPDSPYRSWYTFNEYPHKYTSWWGFETLPTVNKLDPAFTDYIFGAEDSVIAHWLNLGADGFRLDVADELPNEFMDAFKKRLREIRPDALLMGEVWEDASNKIAYDIRRRYFVDGTLDSVMNYPFRTAILRFLRWEESSWDFAQRIMTIVENYPEQVLHCNMNLLGTHDTPRILTALVEDFDGTREQLAQRRLSPEQLQLAKMRLRQATVLQFTLPGSPGIYYGDEAGMEGGKDPFNRRTYPWGHEDPELLAHYRLLGQLRKAHPALQRGQIAFETTDGGRLAFTRGTETETLRICINRADSHWEVGGRVLACQNTEITACGGTMAPGGWCIMEG